MMRSRLAVCLAVALVPAATPTGSRRAERVELVRVPNEGIQPEVAVDRDGTLHMVYLAGDPAAADVFYVRSTDGGRTFSPAVRVNSQPGSAIATGTIRGAHLAVGRGGRVHVAWNGSSAAVPKPPADPKTGRSGMPMLYARSTPDGSAFERQRNLMTRTIHLDGGGSVAADDRGGVYVTWHANAVEGEAGERHRRVWIARSTNDGVAFGAEAPISDPATGACGCCGLRLAATPQGELHLLYRSARETVHRDIYSLESTDRGKTFTSERLHEWEIGACPMSSMAIVPAPRLLRAWETDGQVYFVDGRQPEAPKSPPLHDEAARGRKHPRLAVNAAGTVLLIWAEGTAWNRGGSMAWQAFARDGTPTDIRGIQPGVPTWSFGAVAARPDGSFVVFY